MMSSVYLLQVPLPRVGSTTSSMSTRPLKLSQTTGIIWKSNIHAKEQSDIFKNLCLSLYLYSHITHPSHCTMAVGFLPQGLRTFLFIPGTESVLSDIFTEGMHIFISWFKY